jgi:hypothetical protein
MKTLLVILLVVSGLAQRTGQQPGNTESAISMVGCQRATFRVFSSIWYVQASKATWNPFIYQYWYQQAVNHYGEALKACGIAESSAKSVKDLLAYSSPAKAWIYWQTLNPLLVSPWGFGGRM